MIQVINRAFDILELIAKDAKKTFSLTEIADALDLNYATCANILKTMVHRNYIEQLGHKKGYRLGYMAYQVSGDLLFEKSLIAIAKTEMKKLTKTLNETSLLAIRKKDIRISLHQELSNNDLMVKSKTEKHVYSSASGRMLVAILPDAEKDQFVTKYGLPTKEQWPEAANKRGFNTAIGQIKKQGYAKQISEAHIVGYAVPILKGTEPIASLSVYLPVPRANTEKEQEILMALQESAEIIHKKLQK